MLGDPSELGPVLAIEVVRGFADYEPRDDPLRLLLISAPEGVDVVTFQGDAAGVSDFIEGINSARSERRRMPLLDALADGRKEREMHSAAVLHFYISICCKGVRSLQTTDAFLFWQGNGLFSNGNTLGVQRA